MNKTHLKKIVLGILPFAIVGVVVAQDSALPTLDRGAEMLPPNAKPGECYARVFVPPVYRTVSENMLVKEASERIEIVPARYDWVDEKVLIKEASQRLEVVPATYDWVTEQIEVQPASFRVENVPAVYETVTEKVLDRPAHTVWKKGEGPIQRVDNGTGEIMCLVEVPATYKTVTRQVLKSPARTRKVDITAEHKTVKKQVLKSPPSTRTVEIPAEYDTIRVRRLASPESTTKFDVPAEYRTITKTEKKNDGHMEWQAVLCQTNSTPGVITKIQRALRDAGYNPGQIDGVIGQETLRAIERFQTAKGLPRGGLTLATIKALGVNV